MAVTKIIPIHAKGGKSVRRNISSVIRYTINPDKTDNGELISCSGCDWHTADKEFLLTYNQYISYHGKKSQNDIVAYHLIQSFKPGEISPEDANRVGYEFASRLLKGKYDFIVSTHEDHLHIHNHIVFSAVSNNCKNKFRNCKDSYKKIQAISDQVCTEHQLSVIEKAGSKSLKYNVWLQEQKDRPQLLVDVNKALAEKGVGYRIWAGKHNIQQLAKAYNFMMENKIRNVSELENIVNDNNRRIVLLRKQAQTLQSRFDDTKEMKTHLLNYVKYKDIYIEYKNRGYDNRFYEKHKVEIDLVKAAKESFKEYGDDKLPSIREINEELEEIQTEKNKAYTELKQLAIETKDLHNYADNIKTLLGNENSEQPEKKKTKTKIKEKER